jgi:hypothetical protein
LRRFKVVHGKSGVSTAMESCLGQDSVVCGVVRLFTAKQAVLRGGGRLFATEQGYPRQDNLVCGDATLSTAEQGYPGQIKVAGRKLALRHDG